MIRDGSGSSVETRLRKVGPTGPTRRSTGIRRRWSGRQMSRERVYDSPINDAEEFHVQVKVEISGGTGEVNFDVGRGSMICTR